VDDDMLDLKKKKRSSLVTTILAHVLLSAEAHALLDTPKFSVVADCLVDNTLKKIGGSIDPESMLAVCDMTRVVTEKSTRQSKDESVLPIII